MPRYDVDLRRLAVSLMEGGAGKVALARALAIPPGTAKNWMLTYGAVGAERFIETGSTHRAHDTRRSSPRCGTTWTGGSPGGR